MYLLRRVFFSVLIYVVFSNTGYSQEQRIDTLKKKLAMSIVKDTSYINLLTSIGKEIWSSDPEMAAHHAREAITLGEESGFARGEANGYRLLGMSLFARGKYVESKDAYLKALEIYRRTGDREQQSKTLSNLGSVYTRMFDYKTGLEFHLQSLALAETIGNKRWVANQMNNIGNIYCDQNQLDRALGYYRKAYTYSKAFNELSLMGHSSNNIGLVQMERKKYDSSRLMFEESMRVRKQISDDRGVSSCLLNLALTSMHVGNLSEALSLVSESLVVKTRIKDFNGQVTCLITRSKILIMERDFDAAKLDMQKAFVLSNELKLRDPEIFELHAIFYKATNDYKNALQWQTRFHELKDSIFNQTTNKQLAGLQSLYELSEKQNRILTLEQERARDRIMWSVVIAAIFVLLIIVTIRMIVLRIQMTGKQQRYQIEVKLQNQTIENALLREKQMQDEIDKKNRELASYTMNFVQKSELMEQLKVNLQDVQAADERSAKKLNAITKLIDSNYKIDRDWEDFKLRFESVHTDFFKLLKEKYPDLTSADMKLCALLRLNMNIKEAAEFLGTTPDSAKTARWRLRQRFKLPKHVNLVDFILNIDKPHLIQKETYDFDQLRESA
jgi:tetratricopeptide (TPR) repeat protein